ncbi:GDSL-type esterase/lipase family protein [Nocardia arizonensis]|uniref:GDSL-type esterase/lipase family protein n=1 Tax=Nocardia arizonensis TaxID=1141647 RepID=UPI0006CF4741|nr:GDSL-type esterase/lipase family protein [Nocardia arizonensis]
MVGDLRICCVGDSYVAGVGDPECRGWTGRLAVEAAAAGLAPTVYNLGVRRQTSVDVLRRFLPECEQRLPASRSAGVVLAVGANDATHENGGPRVLPEVTVEALTVMLGEAAARGWRTLVVGPPPLADPAHTARTADLDRRFAELCAAQAVPYVGIHESLCANPTWTREVAAGDGAHPGAAGYEALAELVRPRWRRWLSY